MFLRSIIPLVCFTVIHGFVPASKFGVTKRTTALAGTMDAYNQQLSSNYQTSYTRADLHNKEFQLEELEDKEQSETDIWLNQDGSVTLGASNGPLVRSYEGEWHVLETAGVEYYPFRMRLTRRFESPGSGNIGDIQYELTREFWGSIEMIGDAISVTGKIHGALPSMEVNEYAQMYHDDVAMQESEVGYFTMVDAVASEGVAGVKGRLHP